MRGGEIRPVYGVGWTLNMEMFFYLIGFIAVKIDRKRCEWIVTAIIAAFVIARKIFKPTSAILMFWGSMNILDFLVGVWIYKLQELFLPRSKPLGKAGLLVVALLVSLLFTNTYVFGTEINAWTLRLLNGAVLLYSAYFYQDLKCSRFLVLLGDMSYSIYMTHFFVIGLACRVIMKDLTVTVAHTLIVICAVVIALACSWIVYQIFEVRLTPWLYKVFHVGKQRVESK